MAYENRPPRHGPDNCNNGLSGGQILLIILACLLVIGLIAALIAWLMQSKNKNKSNSKQNIVQIGGLVPQNNIQQPQNAQNQPTLNTNQPAAPVMQNNVVQPFTQNNPVPVDTTINQQELISNVVAAATPQIMASMAQIAAQEAEKEQLNQEAVPAPEKETENEKEETTNKKSDDSNLQKSNKVESINDDSNEDEEERRHGEEKNDMPDDIGKPLFAGLSAGKIAGNAAGTASSLDLATMLRSLSMQEKPTNEQRSIPEQNNIGSPHEQQPERNFSVVGSSPDSSSILFAPKQNNQLTNENNKPMHNDIRIVGGTPEAPSIVFNENKFNDGNEKYAKIFDQLISPSRNTQQPVSTTRMPLPTVQLKQKDDIALDNDEQIELVNNNKFANDNPETPMPNNMMPEPNTQGNNLPNNVMPPMEAMGGANTIPNKPVMSGNSTFNQLQPINEDEIEPETPPFGPPLVMQPKMQDAIRSPSILQAPKERSSIEELPIPMQVNAQNKEQDKNSQKANEGAVVNPFMQFAHQNPNLPIKKKNNNPMLSTLSGGGKQMEANNRQSQMNLGTQNECMRPSCTGGNM